MEGISLTGDGSDQNPYMITQISDERDFLMFLQEEFGSQQLDELEDRILDKIQCKSGKEVYFDITKAYLRLQELTDKGEKGSL